MQFFVYGALLLFGATVVLALLWCLLRSAFAGWRWRRLWRGLLVCVALVPVHFLVVLPGFFGFVGSRWVDTRGDERRYQGPRFDAQGDWLLQSRQSLREEPEPAPPSPCTVWLQSGDGLRLRAFVVPPRPPERGVSAVLVHGLFRNALELETVGDMFQRAGVEVLLLELRNHGGSDRAPATYGVREQQDVLAAVHFLRARPGHGERPVVLFGVSLGTAAVALAAPQVDRLAGIVLDAPIESLTATAHHMLAKTRNRGRRVVEVWQPFRSLTFAAMELWSGFAMASVLPGEALARLPQSLPVLLIGAGDDDRTPPDSVRRLYDALPQPEGTKRLWIRQGAEHGQVWETDPAGYEQRLLELLRQIAP